MNDATELLERARSLGARLWTNDGIKLEMDAPADFPDALVDELRMRKQALLSALRSTPPVAARKDLLAWAAGLAEQETVLPEPVHFRESPLRPVWVTHVSRYACDQLRALASARVGKESGGWSYFTPEWWEVREQDALSALASLKQAMGSAS